MLTRKTLKGVCTEVSTWMFTAALFTISKNWKQPQLPPRVSIRDMLVTRRHSTNHDWVCEHLLSGRSVHDCIYKKFLEVQTAVQRWIQRVPRGGRGSGGCRTPGRPDGPVSPGGPSQRQPNVTSSSNGGLHRHYECTQVTQWT